MAYRYVTLRDKLNEFLQTTLYESTIQWEINLRKSVSLIIHLVPTKINVADLGNPSTAKINSEIIATHTGHKLYLDWVE